ncbi:MAG: DUF2064 domain-containing protein [Streptomyces sp.]|uniref:TIGR04282 family arsenosugar biosynthesis glycosyltransferase n=1 Tax=Streptomyces sp. TaxID=1931 RepID=UPI0025D1B1F6|nr:DUF2064 domain-containing protein [Streptomyces sp.]MBW8792034.1 DUF2064 domain-containing protein [Streptomyces sp.]
MSEALTLIVLAKEPRPGYVKTRLVPPLTASDAARIAAAALHDTLDVVDRTPAGRRVLAFAGDAAGWQRRGWDTVTQPAGGLDVRLAAALAAAHGPALLVGMDTPQLQPADLAAFDPRRFDAALGLAPDGGYWAIGLRDPAQAAAAVHGVPMSTEHTGVVQLARLRRLGLRVQLLPPRTDVDTIDSARAVAAVAPSTRFAAVFAAVAPPVAVPA